MFDFAGQAQPDGVFQLEIGRLLATTKDTKYTKIVLASAISNAMQVRASPLDFLSFVSSFSWLEILRSDFVRQSLAYGEQRNVKIFQLKRLCRLCR